MIQLERKDVQKFRPKGIRRYWIVTSIDAVAKHIKTHQKELAHEEVYTEDFTTMYTKLPPESIKEGVKVAVTEAFQFFNPKATFNLKFDRKGKAEAVIEDNGAFCLSHAIDWIQMWSMALTLNPAQMHPPANKLWVSPWEENVAPS